MEQLYLELGAAAVILIGTAINVYLHFHGHRHNARDIDITILDRSYNGRNFNADRPLNLLWSVLLEQLKISIEVNPLPKEDLLISDTETKGIIKNMPYSEVQELKDLPVGSIKEARRIMREAFKDDPDFKQSYIANISMRVFHDLMDIQDSDLRDKMSERILDLVFEE